MSGRSSGTGGDGGNAGHHQRHQQQQEQMIQFLMSQLNPQQQQQQQQPPLPPSGGGSPHPSQQIGFPASRGAPALAPPAPLQPPPPASVQAGMAQMAEAAARDAVNQMQAHGVERVEQELRRRMDQLQAQARGHPQAQQQQQQQQLPFPFPHGGPSGGGGAAGGNLSHTQSASLAIGMDGPVVGTGATTTSIMGSTGLSQQQAAAFAAGAAAAAAGSTGPSQQQVADFAAGAAAVAAMNITPPMQPPPMNPQQQTMPLRPPPPLPPPPAPAAAMGVEPSGLAQNLHPMSGAGVPGPAGVTFVHHRHPLPPAPSQHMDAASIVLQQLGARKWELQERIRREKDSIIQRYGQAKLRQIEASAMEKVTGEQATKAAAAAAEPKKDDPNEETTLDAISLGSRKKNKRHRKSDLDEERGRSSAETPVAVKEGDEHKKEKSKSKGRKKQKRGRSQSRDRRPAKESAGIIADGSASVKDANKETSSLAAPSETSVVPAGGAIGQATEPTKSIEQSKPPRKSRRKKERTDKKVADEVKGSEDAADEVKGSEDAAAEAAPVKELPKTSPKVAPKPRSRLKPKAEGEVAVQDGKSADVPPSRQMEADSGIPETKPSEEPSPRRGRNRIARKADKDGESAKAARDSTSGTAAADAEAMVEDAAVEITKESEQDDEIGPQSSKRRKRRSSKRGISSKEPSVPESEGDQAKECDQAMEGDAEAAEGEEKYDMADSYSFLRHTINTCSRVLRKSKATRGAHKRRKKNLGSNLADASLIFYPDAPFGQIWRDTVNEDGEQDGTLWKIGRKSPPPLDAGGTILGRHWVWDEGQYADDDTDAVTISAWRSMQNELPLESAPEETSIKALVEAAFDGTSEAIGALPTSPSNSVPSVMVNSFPSAPSCYVPPHLRAYCLCGKDHAILPAEGSETASKPAATPMSGLQSVSSTTSARKRRSERQGSSVSLTNVLGELARGELNPHTLISCEEYKSGPDLRFLRDEGFIEEDCPGSPLPSSPSETFARRLPTSLSDIVKATRLNPEQVQPFSIKICPDVMLLADLQSHLSESEIIGFLGGRYVESDRCIYVQAAFPCKATSRDDEGFTDVEMDPVSQIVAGETIAKHGLEVVGWYHSHPSFQPDPSVTDIHNQANYQQLFGDHGHAVEVQEGETNQAIPFVGLIVGTYDSKNPSAESVMNWFHVSPKQTGNVTSAAANSNNSSSKRALGRGSSFVGAPSLTTERGWVKERVYFPMKLQVTHRERRRFSKEEEAIGVGADEADEVQIRREMTAQSTAIRRQNDSRHFLCALSQHRRDNLPPVSDNAADIPMLCQPIQGESEQGTDRPIESNTKAPQEEGIVCKGGEGERTDQSADDTKSDERPTLLPSDAIAAFRYGSSSVISRILGENDAVKESKGPPHLLGDLLPDVRPEVVSSNNYIHPLPFNKKELSILRLGNSDGVSDLIHAGVIWHAVEREQLSFSGREELESGSFLPLQPPPSSNSILDLLLQLPPNAATDQSSVFSSDVLPQELLADDAALVHTIDVILSHYSTNSQRIDPFGIWTGSGDKGLVSKKSFQSFVGVSDEMDGRNEWEQYYLGTIMGVLPTADGGGGASGSGKMRRGHKICACLLKWARRMHFLPHRWSELGFAIGDIPAWDHERATSIGKPHVLFVAEIMRLLAARWREADETGLSGRRKRRHRPSTPRSIQKASAVAPVEGERSEDGGREGAAAEEDPELQAKGTPKSAEEEKEGPKVPRKGAAKRKSRSGLNKNGDYEKDDWTYKERDESKQLSGNKTHSSKNVCNEIDAAVRRGDVTNAIDPNPRRQESGKHAFTCIVRECPKTRRPRIELCQRHKMDWLSSGQPLPTLADMAAAAPESATEPS